MRGKEGCRREGLGESAKVGDGKVREWGTQGVEERRGGARVSRKGRGHGRRWWRTSMGAGEVGMADIDKNPQRRELGPRRQRLERRSTGAPTGADRAAGGQDAGTTVCTTYRAAQSEKPDMMPKYRWTGVLYWSAGGVRQAVVRNRAAISEALARILSVGS